MDIACVERIKCRLFFFYTYVYRRSEIEFVYLRSTLLADETFL